MALCHRSAASLIFVGKSGVRSFDKRAFPTMIDVASLPTLQAATSSTFTRPPIKESPTIPEIYAFHALNSPQHPLFIHADDTTGSNREICYPEAYAAIQRGHTIVSRNHSDLSGDATKSTVVGILAIIGT